MGQVQGSKCSCGRVVVPARRHCPDCQRIMKDTKLEAQGTVETHTTIRVPPEGFDGPLYVAVVRIAEGARSKPPVRVIARSQEGLETGQRVNLAPQGEVLWAEVADGK